MSETESSRQSEIWSVVAADRQRLVRSWSLDMWNTVLDAAGAAPGLKLLDAGCGSGELSELAAERGCSVAGVDVAPGMIELCLRRVPNGEFRVGDMEKLPWPDGSFDAVASCNAVHFTKNPSNAIAEFRRVLRPGGCLAITSNGPRAGYPASEVFHALRAAAPRPEESGDPFRLAEPGVLEGLLAAAGFALREVRSATFSFVTPTIEAAWKTILSIGPNRVLAEQLGETQSRALIDPILKQHEQADGSVAMYNKVRVLVATSP